MSENDQGSGSSGSEDEKDGSPEDRSLEAKPQCSERPDAERPDNIDGGSGPALALDGQPVSPMEETDGYSSDVEDNAESSAPLPSVQYAKTLLSRKRPRNADPSDSDSSSSDCADPPRKTRSMSKVCDATTSGTDSPETSRPARWVLSVKQLGWESVGDAFPSVSRDPLKVKVHTIKAPTLMSIPEEPDPTQLSEKDGPASVSEASSSLSPPSATATSAGTLTQSPGSLAQASWRVVKTPATETPARKPKSLLHSSSSPSPSTAATEDPAKRTTSTASSSRSATRSSAETLPKRQSSAAAAVGDVSSRLLPPGAFQKKQNGLVAAAEAPQAPKAPAKAAKERRRCGVCNRKLGLTAIRCRCGGLYCAVHRYDREHNCTFDYKTLGREELRRNNPKVVAEKLRRL